MDKNPGIFQNNFSKNLNTIFVKPACDERDIVVTILVLICMDFKIIWHSWSP